METREELIKGLHYVKNGIRKIMDVQQEQVRIVAQYRQEEAAIPTSGVKDKGKLLLVVLGGMLIVYYLIYALLSGGFGILLYPAAVVALAFWSWRKKSKMRWVWVALMVASLLYTAVQLRGYFISWVLLAVSAAAAFFAVRYAVRAKNGQIERNNAEISRQNSELQAQYDRATGQLAELKKELVGSTSSWYPKNYYSLNAVDFFIHAVENYRADSVKEMVNLFESTKEHQEIARAQEEINRSLRQQTLNQEEIKRQMRYANVLNVANLAMQAGTQAAINGNTFAVNQNTSAARDVANGVDRLAGTARDILRKL